MGFSPKNLLVSATLFVLFAAAGCGGSGSAALAPLTGPGPATSPTLIPTPTAPAPTPTPIAISAGGTVGTPTFPPGNTASGGQGAPVDGIPCAASPPQNQLHIHPHLSFYVNGTQLAIPLGVGIINAHVTSGFADSADCFYYVHTHDATGIIHIETPFSFPAITLGNLFHIWGQPLSSSNIAGYTGAQLIYIDTAPYNGDPALIPLDVNKKHITLEVGPPFVYPTFYSY